jgi:hypothetical protein
VSPRDAVVLAGASPDDADAFVRRPPGESPTKGTERRPR